MSDVKGDRSVHAHVSGGRMSVAERRTVTFVRQGPYVDLLELLPKKKGAVWTEGSKRYEVASAELTRSKGGFGLLSVTCLNPVRSSSGQGGEEAEEEEVVLEVESAQVEKPLMSHPDLAAYAGVIELWRDSDPALRSQLKYADAAGDVRDLDGMALVAAELLLRGVESYLEFAPVARRTTRRQSGEAFTGVGADNGKICSLPSDFSGMAAGTWQWLKTGDRSVKTSGGPSERVEEWTASKEWSSDLYESASGSGSGGGSGGSGNG